MIAIVSDTHMPKGSRRLPDACLARLTAAELIIHAGDFSTATTLAELELIGPPVLGVHGNVDDADVQRQLPAARTLEHAGARIAVVHDAGAAAGRARRLRRRFPDVDAVVFGHSHIPLHETVDGLTLFNPGSPTERRRAPTHTMGIADLHGGALRFELVDLD